MQVAIFERKIRNDASLDLTFRDVSFTTGKGKTFSCFSLLLNLESGQTEVNFTVTMCSANPTLDRMKPHFRDLLISFVM